jgi:hypothetical protein
VQKVPKISVEKKQKELFLKESEDEREEEQQKRTRKMVRNAPGIKRSSKHSREYYY